MKQNHEKPDDCPNWIFLFFSMIFLISGVVCYVFFCPDAVLTKFINNYIFIRTMHFKSEFIEMILNSFSADFFWSVSFTLAIQGVLNLSGKKQFYLLYCSCLGIFFELLQLFNIVNGVFDILDIIVYIIGAFSAIGFIKLIRRFIL